MQILGIIQARMGSKRLKGKSLALLKGKPSLQHLIESLLQVLPLKEIVIATSQLPEDDAIASFATTKGIAVFRGDNLNVASRFFKILSHRNPEFFARLNGDSPLLDCASFKEMIQSISKEEDIYSTLGGGYPSGTNMEIIKTTTFLEAYPHFCSEDHFEHVTKYFYENEKQFKINRFVSSLPNPQAYKFSLDTAEDFQRIEKMFKKFDKEHYHYSLNEKCQIFDEIMQ